MKKTRFGSSGSGTAARGRTAADQGQVQGRAMYDLFKNIVYQRLIRAKWNVDARTLSTTMDMANLVADYQFAAYLFKSHTYTRKKISKRMFHAYMRSFNSKHQSENLKCEIIEKYSMSNADIDKRTCDEIVNAFNRVEGVEGAVWAVQFLTSYASDQFQTPHNGELVISSGTLTNICKYVHFFLPLPPSFKFNEK